MQKGHDQVETEGEEEQQQKKKIKNVMQGAVEIYCRKPGRNFLGSEAPGRICRGERVPRACFLNFNTLLHLLIMFLLSAGKLATVNRAYDLMSGTDEN